MNSAWMPWLVRGRVGQYTSYARITAHCWPLSKTEGQTAAFGRSHVTSLVSDDVTTICGEYGCQQHQAQIYQSLALSPQA